MKNQFYQWKTKFIGEEQGFLWKTWFSIEKPGLSTKNQVSLFYCAIYLPYTLSTRITSLSGMLDVSQGHAVFRIEKYSLVYFDMYLPKYKCSIYISNYKHINCFTLEVSDVPTSTIGDLFYINFEDLRCRTKASANVYKSTVVPCLFQTGSVFYPWGYPKYPADECVCKSSLICLLEFCSLGSDYREKSKGRKGSKYYFLEMWIHLF